MSRSILVLYTVVAIMIAGCFPAVTTTTPVIPTLTPISEPTQTFISKPSFTNTPTVKSTATPIPIEYQISQGLTENFHPTIQIEVSNVQASCGDGCTVYTDIFHKHDIDGDGSTHNDREVVGDFISVDVLELSMELGIGPFVGGSFIPFTYVITGEGDEFDEHYDLNEPIEIKPTREIVLDVMRTHTLVGPFLDYRHEIDYNMKEWHQLTGRYPSVVSSYMGWDKWTPEGGIGIISPHDPHLVARQLKEYGTVHVLNLSPMVYDENLGKATIIDLSPDLDQPVIPGQDVTKRQFLDELLEGYNEIGTPVILNIGHEHQWDQSWGGFNKYPSGIRVIYDYVQQKIGENPGGSVILGFHPMESTSLWPIGTKFLPSNGVVDVINVSAYRHPQWGTGAHTPERLVQAIVDTLSISPNAIIGVGETGSSVQRDTHYTEFFKAVVESPVHIGIIILFNEDSTILDPKDDGANWIIPPSYELKEALAHPQYLDPIIYR